MRGGTRWSRRGRRFPPEVLTDGEVRALLEACGEDGATALGNRALLVVMYRAGLRIREALALHPKDLDADGGAIRVLWAKGGRARTVGIDPAGMVEVGRWLAAREVLGVPAGSPAFCGATGRAVTMVDAELARMGHLFNKAYSDKGRPSVPPETLLKALLLQALYAIRSEAQLVERIDTDLLFRWFLDMDPAMDAFDATAFTHNRPRLAEFGIIQRFFDGVVRKAMDEGLTSDEHFSADGSLVRSYASLKILKPIDPETGEFIEEDDDDHPTTPNATAQTEREAPFNTHSAAPC